MFEITINGRSTQVDARPETPLLWALREHLGMTGTKFGCGAGLCGACTVHLNGEAVRACQVQLSELSGKEVTTIEGLSSNGLHPLQKAWIVEQTPQCGYCQSGQIMSATALLHKTPRPNDQQIKDAMSGNICRCGTYTRIHAAIKHASQTALQAADASANKGAAK